MLFSCIPILMQDHPTPTHPNALRIMAAKEAVTPGADMEPMASVQHQHMLAHIPGNSPIAGEWHDRDALMAAVLHLGRLAEGTLQIFPYVLATDQFAFNYQRITARRKGRVLDQVLLEVWRLEEGKCIELWDHFQDLEAWDAFWQ